MGHLYAETGDVGFGHSSGVTGAPIRWATRSKNETPTWANHSLLFTTPGIVGPLGELETKAIPESKQARAVEALWHVKHHRWYKAHHKDTGYRVKVFRPTWLSLEEREAVVENALQHVGERYGWWKLLFQFTRKASGGRINLAKLLFLDSRPICSYLVSNAFEEEGWPDAFGPKIPPQAQDPDDQHDFCEWASYENALWKYVGETGIV